MSYDYILMKGEAKAGLEALAALSETVGQVESVKTSISQAVPSVRWKEGPGNCWHGRSEEAEFMFLVAGTDDVRMLHMSHCERAVVERVAKALGLVAIDEQSEELFDG
ncbi:hypothetical protein HNQ60_001205 [Povalibacter uvarum]|uniref:Uncharacterized protein n=1 Tax=Povalibacter uvarum TaxID=732238 RepID=A0A841HIZ2_9GAMM|nr:hypothetical protein [Povalibacter uvarum]MBB6092359.1 hypothetical protein [Povalibacter uvarum]